MNLKGIKEDVKQVAPQRYSQKKNTSAQGLRKFLNHHELNLI